MREYGDLAYWAPDYPQRPLDSTRHQPLELPVSQGHWIPSMHSFLVQYVPFEETIDAFSCILKILEIFFKGPAEAPLV